MKKRRTIIKIRSVRILCSLILTLPFIFPIPNFILLPHKMALQLRLRNQKLQFLRMSRALMILFSAQRR